MAIETPSLGFMYIGLQFLQNVTNTTKEVKEIIMIPCMSSKLKKRKQNYVKQISKEECRPPVCGAVWVYYKPL
jgi:hypothetical protein